MPIPVEFFPLIEGSMTSDDGQKFLLQVRRDDGSKAQLGFPHSEIPNLIECAAMQISNGADKGKPVVTAFHTSGFQIGRGPNGEMVLNMIVGETGKIGFLISPEMRKEMIAMLAKAETKH